MKLLFLFFDNLLNGIYRSSTPRVLKYHDLIFSYLHALL